MMADEDPETPLQQAPTLYSLCACRIVRVLVPTHLLPQLQSSLPSRMVNQLVRVQSEIARFTSTLLRNIPTSLPTSCFRLDSSSSNAVLDERQSILAMEVHLSRPEFFDVCARFAMDEETERAYALMTSRQKEQLLEHDVISWCRALELSPRRAIIHYEDVAYYCAANGYQNSLERSLLRVRSDDGALLPKCVMLAILNHHYHIANQFISDSYQQAFYSVFPGGNIEARLFAVLLDETLLKNGLQIASELLEWMPELSIQRLRRDIEREEEIPRTTLMRFESMYGEMTDQRDYPNEE